MTEEDPARLKVYEANQDHVGKETPDSRGFSGKNRRTSLRCGGVGRFTAHGGLAVSAYSQDQGIDMISNDGLIRSNAVTSIG